MTNSNRRSPSFIRQVLREAPVLVPAGIVFAVVQGGGVEDWLAAIAGTAIVGLGLGWLIYQRELIKARPVARKQASRPSKRKR